MKKTVYLLLCVLLAVFSVSCKKSEKEILEDNWKSAEKSQMNTEIRKLRDKVPSAKDDYERADIYQKISDLESEKGDTASAMKSANESVKYYPNSAKSHYLLGKNYLASGRLREAEEELATAVQMDEKLAPAHFEMGNLNYKQGDRNKAIEEYKLAAKYDPADFQAYNNLGVLYYQAGDSKKAAEALAKVASLKPEYPLVYKNLGILYETKLADPARAIENYNKYLKYRPNAPDRAAVRMWISRLGGKS